MAASRPRVGFLGVGWIGRHRMEAMLATGAVEAAAIADAAPAAAAAGQALAPGAALVGSLDEMLDLGLDGMVIATPSAMHAGQTIRALERGAAVFCQKPLGRTGKEVRSAVDAARRADRLLAVDLSYRHTAGMRAIRDLVAAGELGRVFAVDLVFHNAYGPDKPWFYDRAQAGGGCVMDLGVHLVDLALWTLGFPPVRTVSGRLFAGGAPLAREADTVEDYATATIDLRDGTSIALACSWRLHAGRDALIGATFHGTGGGASFRNVGGSFFDFTAERHRGTASEALAAPPDEWGGRAAAEWATRLANGVRFDPRADELVEVAEILDLVYANGTSRP